MKHCFVCAKEGVLQGVFTQKKLLWEDLEKNCDALDLVIKLSEAKVVPLNYDKMCKYLGRRGMLVIYLDSDMHEFAAQDIIDECPATYRIWDVIVNEHYTLQKGSEE